MKKGVHSYSSEGVVRCAIYTRKSTDRGLEKEVNSLEAQRDICSAYIRSQRHRGWTELERRYDDGGQSGGNLDRPALQTLLTDIEAGRVDVVVIYKLDRLTRSLTDFVRLLDQFERFGVSFSSITQAFDTGDSMGRLVLNVLLTFAQFERELLSDRLRDKFAALRRRGKWSGGSPPFGFDLIEGRLVINPVEAQHVRDVFDQYPKAKSGNQLMRDFRARGVRSKRWVTRAGKERGGYLFGSGQLHRVLTNPIYIGYLAHEGKLYEGEHEAIVSRGAWDRVQAVRAKRNADQIPRDPSRQILHGLLHDRHGRRMKMSAQANQHGAYRYYVSERTKWGDRKRLKGVRCDADEAEDLVLAGLQSFLRDRSALSAAIATMGVYDADVCRTLDAGEVAAARIARFDLHRRRSLLQAVVRRIELDHEHVRVLVSCFELVRLLGWDGIGHFRAGAGAPKAQADRVHLLKIPAAIARESGIVTLPPAPAAEAMGGAINPPLVRLIHEAREAQSLLYTRREVPLRELARSRGRGPSFFARLVRLNYLAPDIVSAILDGHQPPTLTRKKLGSLNLPLDWAQQRQLLGFTRP